MERAEQEAQDQKNQVKLINKEVNVSRNPDYLKYLSFS